MKILITGGAGFVGSNLAFSFKQKHPHSEIVVFDNLKRRGSELNLKAFKKQGIQFLHGDIRSPGDFDSLQQHFDLFIEASAEPSVLAGLNSSPKYLLETNLIGTLNCLEFARRQAKNMIFLSTSRVYSIRPLREVGLNETLSRFELSDHQTQAGITALGVSESFATHLPRSLYGASKLASELVVQEYADTYGLNIVIDRCGVIAGPGQFGKVDQGVFTLWVANHYFRKDLAYMGFGGKGKQVRDLLHPLDLYALIETQASNLRAYSGQVFNCGGGRRVSTSLLELTTLCEEITGNQVKIECKPETSPVDIPLYISDSSKAQKEFGFEPKRDVREIVQSIYSWIKANETDLKPIFAE